MIFYLSSAGLFSSSSSYYDFLSLNFFWGFMITLFGCSVIMSDGIHKFKLVHGMEASEDILIPVHVFTASDVFPSVPTLIL